MRLLLLALVACRGKVDETGSPGPGGEWEGVEIDLDPFSLKWGTGAIPDGGIQVGWVDPYDSSVSYDPWNLYGGVAEAVPDITWATATRATWSAGQLDLELDDGHTARLEHDGSLGFRLTVDDGPAPYVRLAFASPEGEALYGLGENFDAVDNRGRSRPMQREVSADLESGYIESHVPVPLVVSSGGWGAGLLSDWPMAVDVAAEDPEEVVFVVATEDAVDFRLLGAGEVGEPAPGLDLVATWTRATGLPKLPPTWAFAPMIWRDENESDTQILEDARAVRDNDLAFGVMWVDNPWQTTYNSMQPDGRFADWDGMVTTLHDLGFRWLAWTTPYLEESDPEYDDYASAGWLAPVPLLFNDFGDLIDLTDPGAMDAWQGRVEAAAARGLEGWKLDYGEDVNLGLGSGRLVTGFADGSDERTMHHRYAAFYHRAYADPYDEQGQDRFLLGRGGAWGTQALTDCIWPGDLCNDFHTHGEDGHVGGLPAAVRAGISLSVSGFPCFASDTGGYRHGRAGMEAIIRWTEYSATLPVMQVGGTEEHHYWLLDGDWTEQVLEVGQRYTQLHIRLFPYFYRLLVDAAESGVPPLRPPGLVGAPDAADAFFVGASLFVAPVEVEGATERDVAFPDGRWVHWWTGEAYEGEETVAAPLGEGPLFMGEGAIVPMLRESVRTLSPSDGSVDSWADDPGPLVVRHVPGDGRFEVVDGPLVVAGGGELAIGTLGVYTGASVEIWAPGATRLFVDGAEVDAETDGTWLRGETGSGTVSWE